MKPLFVLAIGVFLGAQAIAATAKLEGYIRLYNQSPGKRFGIVSPFNGPKSYYFKGEELVNLSPDREDLNGLCVTFEVTDDGSWAKNVTEVPCK
jgi:hypothetical protein